MVPRCDEGTPSVAVCAESRFRAMGSDAHVIVVGGTVGLVRKARARIDELERRWSRFIPDSEVSRLTTSAGEWLEVSADTLCLVARAVEAWWLTGASFDPTVLGDLVRAGYDRSFPDIQHDTVPTSALLAACTDIQVHGSAVRLPAGTGFDPGGIGKGLAADLVVSDLMAAGADGACVNLGGDLRVAGTAPDGGTWTVEIDPIGAGEPLALLGIGAGAVATSTTLRRRWLQRGRPRHHLIDPATGEPSTTDITVATVVAGDGWVAEVLAKSVLLRGSDHPFDLIDGLGAEALIVTEAGDVRTSDGFERFLGEQDGPVCVPPAPTEEAGR